MKSQAPPTINISEIRRILGVNSPPSRRRISGWSGGHPIEPDEQISTESLSLSCTKCETKTAGIHANSSDDFRRCPACSSLLGFCPICQRPVSFKEKYNLLCCDRCHTDFVTKSTIDALIKQDKGSHEIVLSGIRATGQLHLGNYFGALKQFVEYESGNNLCLYFIADWHTLTTERSAKKISENSMAIATAYLALGLDPSRSIIYPQSAVPEIAELALYLAMIQPEGSLKNLPTVKDMVEKSTKQSPFSLGKLYYPVLMAADILGPKATLVPVGRDQIPNVELAAELAEKFNREFGHTFTVPRHSATIKVPGLGGGKMGKSEENSGITLLDTAEEMLHKYRRHGITDPERVKKGMPGKPENCVSVFPIHHLLYAKQTELLATVDRECKDGTRGCDECKHELVTNLFNELAPFRERHKELSGRQDFVCEVLHYGGLKAREIIQPTLVEVREKLGIVTQ